MQLTDFDFHLPDSLIAKFPASPRDHSRLLVLRRETVEISHHHFYDLPKFLSPEDLLILNNTKVFPARLYGTDAKDRKFEVFLLKQLDLIGNRWSCMVRPGKKVKSGLEIRFDENVSGFANGSELEIFEIVFTDKKSRPFIDWLTEAGNSPLPPYIKRDSNAEDKTTYQTVFAKESGSVAAPTAGLHFTAELLQKLRDQGVHTYEMTLHVGYGTFAPIRAQNILDHKMHAEAYSLSSDLWKKVLEARKEKRRVIAVGTTALRALESAPSKGLSGETNLFITPGYEFQVVNTLITNFHVPQSSLYVLVASLVGLETIRKAYQEAIAKEYRFYSYGDAMLIL